MTGCDFGEGSDAMDRLLHVAESNNGCGFEVTLC